MIKRHILIEIYKIQNIQKYTEFELVEAIVGTPESGSKNPIHFFHRQCEGTDIWGTSTAWVDMQLSQLIHQYKKIGGTSLWAQNHMNEK